MRAASLLLTCLALTAGCSAGSDAPRQVPAGSPPAASPAPSRPGGAVASILCRTHRVAIQSEEQALTVDEAAGDQAAAAALRIKIRDAITAARAIPGCDVADLAIPPP